MMRGISDLRENEMSPRLMEQRRRHLTLMRECLLLDAIIQDPELIESLIDLYAFTGASLLKVIEENPSALQNIPEFFLSDMANFLQAAAHFPSPPVLDPILLQS